jgi:deoxyribose-phosphate aldolase
MPAKELTRERLAGMIDHAVLKPEATPEDLQTGCELCDTHRVFSICVRPADVKDACKHLGGRGVMVGTVIGFPHGSVHRETKAAETARAVADGAEEVDMVLNIGRLRGRETAFVRKDIEAVVKAAEGKCVKVILECCYLDEAQKLAGCQATVDAGADFVKTSTGFGTGGATVEDIRLMRKAVGPDFGVKASGGMKNLADAVAMLQAGANRLGTSRTVAMIEELPA